MATITESVYAKAINELLTKLKEEKHIYTAIKIAGLIGVNKFALSKARNQKHGLGKFGGKYRHELLELIVSKTGNLFAYIYDLESNSFIISRSQNVVEELFEEKNIYIYKGYYWRGEPVEVGVGLMVVTIKDEKWYQASLLINNKYSHRNFKDEDPYLLNSTKIDIIGKNIYIDFRDSTELQHRQAAIFHIPKAEVENRKILEGVFATLTRNTPKPISGTMLMTLLSDAEKKEYLLAEKNDNIFFKTNSRGSKYKNRQIVLDKIIDIPPLIYNEVYNKRLEVPAKDIFSFSLLDSYMSWVHLNDYVGIYEGAYIRTRANQLEIFLLQFFRNGSALIYFPSGTGKTRSEPVGRYKWVNRPKNLITASFDYHYPEDHWRFRFILDGEFKNGHTLYGVFSGTEIQSGDPVSGRVRLKQLYSGSTNKEDLLKQVATYSDKEDKEPIDNYRKYLRQISLNSNEYRQLLEDDEDLRLFFSGVNQSTYTDHIYTLPLHENSNLNRPLDNVSLGELETNDETFDYAGDYIIYSLYRDEIEEKQFKYYILKQPFRINKDQSIHLKIKGQRIVNGVAIHMTPVLKINFDASSTAYSHVLFTVNQLHYDQIDHVYGVLTGVHILKNRSEAAAAVLVGPVHSKNSKARKINFDTSKFEAFEVGSDDFFLIDKDDPVKLSTFLSGHFNRYISPPAEPNKKMQSRLEKYRLPFFKSACYEGYKYLKIIRNEDLKNKKQFQNEAEQCLLETLKYLEDAFHHGFCDPAHFREGLKDLHPQEDINLLVNELLPGGSLSELVNEVLDLCENWKRSEVRTIFNVRKGNWTLNL